MIFEKETLKDFLRSFFNLHNITIKHHVKGEDDLWIVDIPHDMRKFFEGWSNLNLCFNRALLPFYPDFSFVTSGSPVLTQIKEAYKENCYITHGYLPVSSVDIQKY
ncbi:MAG: hypothetical protein ABRQ37_25865, partial [Candidatus Eremiobacterota bacterium]